MRTPRLCVLRRPVTCRSECCVILSARSPLVTDSSIRHQYRRSPPPLETQQFRACFRLVAQGHFPARGGAQPGPCLLLRRFPFPVRFPVYPFGPETASCQEPAPSSSGPPGPRISKGRGLPGVLGQDHAGTGVTSAAPNLRADCAVFAQNSARRDTRAGRVSEVTHEHGITGSSFSTRCAHGL
jgi:hypothetical protein